MWRQLYFLSHLAFSLIAAVGEEFIRQVEENIEQAKDTFEGNQEKLEVESGFAYGNKFGFDDEILELNYFSHEENNKETTTVGNRKKGFEDTGPRGYFSRQQDSDFANEMSLLMQPPFQFSKLTTFSKGNPKKADDSKMRSTKGRFKSNNKQFMRNRIFSTLFKPHKSKNPKTPNFSNLVTEKTTLNKWNNQSPFTIDGSADEAGNTAVNIPGKQWDEQVIKVAIGKKNITGQADEDDVILKVWELNKLDENDIDTNAQKKQIVDILESKDQHFSFEEPVKELDTSNRNMDSYQSVKDIEEEEHSKNGTGIENVESYTEDIANDDTHAEHEAETPMQEEWDELFNVDNSFWENKLEPLPQTTESTMKNINLKEENPQQYPTISSTLTKNRQKPGQIKSFITRICQISNSVGIFKLCQSKRLVKRRQLPNKSNMEEQKIKKFKDLIEEKRNGILEKSQQKIQEKNIFVKTKDSLFGGFKSALSGILSVGNVFSSEPSPAKNKRRKYKVKKRILKNQRD